MRFDEQLLRVYLFHCWDMKNKGELNVSSALRQAWFLLIMAPCCIDAGNRPEVHLQSRGWNTLPVFLQQHWGWFQEAQQTSNQQVFDEAPSSVFLWCLSLYLRRRQSPFVFTEAAAQDERFSLKSHISINTPYHRSSLLIRTSTSVRPHITVIPFKAEQLPLVPFKQLIYLTGRLTGDSSLSASKCLAEFLQQFQRVSTMLKNAIS